MSMRAWLSLFERTPGSVLPEVEKVPPMRTEVTSAKSESEVSRSTTEIEPLAEMAAPVSVEIGANDVVGDDRRVIGAGDGDRDGFGGTEWIVAVVVGGCDGVGEDKRFAFL